MGPQLPLGKVVDPALQTEVSQHRSIGVGGGLGFSVAGRLGIGDVSTKALATFGDESGILVAISLSPGR